MSKFKGYFNYKYSTAFALCFLLAFGCGHKAQDQSSKSMTEGQSLMDQRNFDGAIAKYEEIIENNPTNEEAKIKLFHAYAGAGGFEALMLIDVLKTAEKKLAEIKSRSNVKIERKIKDKNTEVIDEALEQLDQILIKVPTLSAKQKLNLNKAISLYEELGLKVDTAGKYNNFKWGTLHAFRLVVNFKAIVVQIKNSKNGSQDYDLKLVEKTFLSNSKEMSTDIYQVVRLYSHSYDKFKFVHEKIENLIAKTIGDPEFKLKVSSMVKDEKEFYENFLKENVSLVTHVVNHYVEVYKGEINKLLKVSNKALPFKADMDQSQLRIRALISLAVKQFAMNEPDAEDALRSIFNLETKTELYRAVIDSIKSESAAPIKEFLSANDGKFKSVVVYLKLLLNDAEESGVTEEVKNELNALKAKVDKELLEAELKEVNLALQSADDAAKNQLETINEMDREALETHRSILNDRIQEIEDYLRSPVAELTSALNSKIPQKEQKQINQILKSIFKSN